MEGRAHLSTGLAGLARYANLLGPIQEEGVSDVTGKSAIYWSIVRTGLVCRPWSQTLSNSVSLTDNDKLRRRIASS